MRFAAAVLLFCPALAFAQPFGVEESTIESTQSAIQRGETTCREVIQAYVDRARAYNGVCTALVTADGAPISPTVGTVRAGAPLQFPTATVAVGTLLPNYSEYKGKADRARPHGGVAIGSRRRAAIRHARRHPRLAARSTRWRR